MKNRIKEFRTNLGLSQHELAKQIGTSQQQIQRIESGVVAARLDVALKLCQTLKKPIEVIFSDSEGINKNLRLLKNSNRFLDDEFNETFNKIGLEIDPRSWTLKILLNGHTKPLYFDVSSAEARRLMRVIESEQQDDDTNIQFVVFDTDNSQIALNLREAAYCHFLFDFICDDNNEKSESDSSVKVFFRGKGNPSVFDVDPDEELDDKGEDVGQFRNIFFELSFIEKNCRLYFVDCNGEHVFLRAGNIALLEVSHSIIDEVIESEQN